MNRVKPEPRTDPAAHGMNQPPHDRVFTSQPPGFTSLFFTELWERFSYYGMRAILLLYLVAQVSSGGLGLDDATATAIYGLYTAGVYIMSIPGGWAADRLIGAQRAVMWGGSAIAVGHVLLAIAGATDFPRLFLLGLAVIVLGTGLLKPNMSALVGQLHDARGSAAGARDAGFTWFYFGINAGATAGPLLVAWLAQHYGWHVGFVAAAVGMAAGLICFARMRGEMGHVGVAPANPGAGGAGRAHSILVAAVAAVVVVLALFFTGTVRISPLTLREHAATVIIAVAGISFAWLLFFAGLGSTERKRVIVLLVLVAASTLFWAGYEQAGSSLTLFAERHTDRMFAGHEYPAGWFQSVPAIFVLLFAPAMAGLWSHLAARGRDLNLIVKFALGLAGMGLGFLVMVGAARVIGHGANGAAGPFWLVATYLLHTLGELCLSPVGLSATTQLAPRRYAGQVMGMWFTSLALGNLFASQLAGSVDSLDPGSLSGYFLRMFEYGAAGTVVLLIIAPWLKRWARP
jgi:POT family proton-dependent oligopeptide transporter